MAELSVIAAQLRRMDSGQITKQLHQSLARTALPLAPMVRASILNIPTHGTRHTGLRLRIAGCVQPWAFIDGPVVSVGVEINAARMPTGEKALPLYMEGAKAPWRHPVFGDREVWVEQEPHPYFYQACSWYGPASRNTIERVLDSITRQISG